jgi:hypothetical protein
MKPIFVNKQVLDPQELLKQLHDRGITQAHVSRETGLSHYTLRNIKNGTTKFLLPSTEKALVEFWYRTQQAQGLKDESKQSQHDAQES